eukprot:CAMPEP_0178926918 /NCGR_PEP_ID=MMETSP0786-20121207/18842_1 /TAXON_ID=186022 /ORGANISM="Thalassionema frauenfeldii, Strain CCMP 1798" /LENGTH=353 /DNA_ID=CAMNT_0020602179 /DNA_START=9 /DNA_END=1070 /DNA_ORIENTATION=+
MKIRRRTKSFLSHETTRTLFACVVLAAVSGVICYNLCLSSQTLDTTLSISKVEDTSFRESLSTRIPQFAAQPPKSAADPMGIAKAHTFGLLDTIPNDAWEQIKKRTLSTSWFANPQNPLEHVNNPGLWNEQNMIPNFDCPSKEMVPPRNKKGETKYVCNPQRLAYPEKKGCLIYSFGCAGDFSFEDEIFQMHNKECEIHVFDPAKAWERENDVPNKNIHYHAWGLRSTYDDSKSVVWPKGRGGGFKTFPETLQELGHVGRTIDILKIDCEGCEWSTVQDWIHLGIQQILIELHGVPSPKGTPNQRWYKKPLNLTEYYGLYKDNGYVLYNKERNGELSLELCFLKLSSEFWNKQ